ncbi:MAG: 50S ribosomal protein L15 [Pseudobacteriovorax sp.]|nr:50S ribosomal protein L15 [Pseudobacteriovorax sp.]
MKSLGNLTPAKGSNKNKKRLGRGPGSGLGKTAGKGHKGQKARKGGKVAPGFEGGQMPLYRRLPKRGFKNPFRVEFNAVNLDTLNRFEAGSTITPETLEQAGLIRKPGKPIKLLGRGSLEKSMTISLHKFSASAKAAVEKAGGKAEEI